MAIIMILPEPGCFAGIIALAAAKTSNSRWEDVDEASPNRKRSC